MDDGFFSGIVLGDVEGDDRAGVEIPEEFVVLVAEVFEPVGGDIFFEGAAAGGDAGQAVIDGVVQKNHDAGLGDLGSDGLFDFVVNSELVVVEIHSGKDAVFLEDVIGDGGSDGWRDGGVLGGGVGEMAFVQLSGAAEQEEQFAGQSNVVVAGEFRIEEGVFIVFFQDQLGGQGLGEVVGEGGFADADDAGD